mmetsp:Transcript_15720/g.41435  ORF Transcript_15720/g.41435 Transcript_15720/m.41435 type:complete len:110 (+) Transcript_15720:585-914(+)
MLAVCSNTNYTAAQRSNINYTRQCMLAVQQYNLADQEKDALITILGASPTLLYQSCCTYANQPEQIKKHNIHDHHDHPSCFIWDCTGCGGGGGGGDATAANTCWQPAAA